MTILVILLNKTFSKGISLMVLGVIIFMFIGIMSVFLVLKQKPKWLKRSKHSMQSKCDSKEILILPRKNTAEYLKYKEDIISRINEQEYVKHNFPKLLMFKLNTLFQ